MIKSSWLKQVMVLAFVLSPVILLADEPGKAATGAKNGLYYRVSPSGEVSVFENTMEVALVLPEISTGYWAYHNFDSRGSAEKQGGYTWQTLLDNGVVVDLKTEVKLLPAGFHIRYTMVPRESVKVDRVRAAVYLAYPGWRGAPYQFESSQGTIPKERAANSPNDGTILEADSPFFSLGSTKAPDGHQMRLSGTKGYHFTLQDNPPWPTVALTHHESASPIWDWKAGKKKTFDFSVTFDPPPALVEPVREPQRPFPYQEEEVQFSNAKDGVKLAGTLTLPEGKGPFPAVLLIHCSGPGDRDAGWLGGHHTFLVLSDYLTRHGIAVLRYDKRGGWQSGGNFQTATDADFAGDALAGFEYLRGRKEVDPRKVGLIGHSEGGEVAPLVASKTEDVAFIVLMAGPGIDYKSLDKIGMERGWKDKGYSDAFISLGAKVYDQIVEEVVKTQDRAQAEFRIRRIIQDGEDQAKRDFPKEFDPAFWPSWFNADDYLTPNKRFQLNYDPEKIFKSVSCPVLGIAGDKNSIIPDVCWSAIEKDLKEGDNPEFTTKLLPGVNHVFQTCKTGSEEEWAANPETVAPQALEFITEWIIKLPK